MVLVGISPEHVALGVNHSPRARARSLLEIQPLSLFPISNPRREIDRFPLLTNEEVEAAFTDGVSLSGGVTSDCVLYRDYIYKRFRPHHSTKYDRTLPAERGASEWRIISQLRKNGIYNVPKILGAYAGPDVFVSKMDRMPGKLACDVMMEGSFDGAMAGRQIGTFLQKFHAINFRTSTVRCSWLYPVLLSKKMDCDEFEGIAKRRHADVFWGSNYPTDVLCWGDAGLKNIMVHGSKHACFDFDQCNWATPEFDLG